MLKRITLENFFSFGEATTIELNPDVNILVGINGSGKSNFLKAIELLYEAIVGDGFENLFLRKWGGFDNVANACGGKKDYIRLSYEFDWKQVVFPNADEVTQRKHAPFPIIYDLKINRSGSNGYFFDEKLAPSDVDYDVFIDVKANKGTVIVGNDENELPKIVNYPLDYPYTEKFSASEPLLGQVPNNINIFIFLKRYIQRIASYHYFDTTLQSPIRQPAIFGSEERLVKDGTNLNTIIHKLKNNHSLAYEKIEELLSDINPNFKDITFNLFGAKSYLMLREKGLANSISIEHISDGTLRYLLLLAIFYNPKRGRLICMDEPETGLHPDMIDTVTDAIKYASKNTQFFVATHSALMLNAFDIEDVLVFEKDEKNQTKVSIKQEEDFEALGDDFLVGQLWLNGQLGGKRW